MFQELFDQAAALSARLDTLENDEVYDEIHIPHGETLTIDSLLVCNYICVHGTLKLLPEAEIVIRDNPPKKVDQIDQGIMVHDGGTFISEGSHKTCFGRSQTGIPLGATTITLQSPPEGWRVGDRLVIPDTRQLAHVVGMPFDTQTEVVEVVDVNGNEISITPTRFAHRIGQLPHMTPHVGNLTRDIVIRSENPSGTRGHAMAMKGSTTYIRNTTFKDMGRTIKQRNVWLSPTNLIGRYPWHLHQKGQCNDLFDNNVVEGSLGWAVAVHSCQGPVISNNLAYNIGGAAFMAEEGDEQATFTGNLAIRCIGRFPDDRGGVHLATDGKTINAGYDGTGFWYRGIGNSSYNNVSADCDFAGFNINGYYQTKNYAAYVPLGVSRDNEAYNCAEVLWLSWSQGGTPMTNWKRNKHENYLGWHIWFKAIESFHEVRHDFVDWVLINDPAISTLSQGAMNARARLADGMHFGNPSYENGSIAIINAVIKDFNVGITCGQNMAGMPDFLIKDCLLANEIDIRIPMAYNPHQDLVIENVEHEPTRVTRPWNKRPSMPPVGTKLWFDAYSSKYPAHRISTTTVNGELYTSDTPRPGVVWWGW